MLDLIHAECTSAFTVRMPDRFRIIEISFSTGTSTCQHERARAANALKTEATCRPPDLRIARSAAASARAASAPT